MVTQKTTIERSTMDGQVDYIELVQRAQRGDEQSLGSLAEIARERLRVYVYRMTLQDDLAQEITQESLLEMCKVLGKLRSADRFWSWLYGIATNKLRRHYRTERALQHAAASEERRRGSMKERQGGLENLVGQELKQIVSNAMRKLRTRHKAVLIMRCYDGMSYAEIAESMGCSEFSSRMLFMRAKQALHKELSRNGFRKGSLLAALVIFGKITAPSKAAAAQLAVPAAAMKVGLLAGAVGVATTKTAVISVAAVGALAVGTVVTTSGPKEPAGPTSTAEVTTQSQVVHPFAVADSARQEYWYYFPQGPDGPVMLRAESGARSGHPDRHLLQNGQLNCSYEGKAVYLNNHRMWQEDLSVFRLPTDDRELTAFLSDVEGKISPMQRVSAGGKGLLVVVEHSSEQASRPWAVRHWNILDEDYFQSDWRTDARIVDNRDAMHKRTWAFFRVHGQINNEDVTGVGRIPFVFASAREHNPWLKLTVGNSVTVVDSDASASVQRANGEVVRAHSRGSFFQGLSRPWMGLHTMDVVRRDAAEQKMSFATALTADGRHVQVTVVQGSTTLVYTIDLEMDVIETIRFLVGDAPVGHLDFEYLQDLETAGSEFAAPQTRRYRAAPDQAKGMLWLIQLANGTLADADTN